MESLIVMMIGGYVFFESFTAINEMKKVGIKRFFHELFNPYYLKYGSLGGYSLGIIYYADEITGWYVLLTIPAIICVLGRLTYRIHKHFDKDLWLHKDAQ